MDPIGPAFNQDTGCPPNDTLGCLQHDRIATAALFGLTFFSISYVTQPESIPMHLFNLSFSLLTTYACKKGIEKSKQLALKLVFQQAAREPIKLDRQSMAVLDDYLEQMMKKIN